MGYFMVPPCIDAFVLYPEGRLKQMNPEVDDIVQGIVYTSLIKSRQRKLGR